MRLTARDAAGRHRTTGPSLAAGLYARAGLPGPRPGRHVTAADWARFITDRHAHTITEDGRDV